MSPDTKLWRMLFGILALYVGILLAGGYFIWRTDRHVDKLTVEMDAGR